MSINTTRNSSSPLAKLRRQSKSSPNPKLITLRAQTLAAGFVTAFSLLASPEVSAQTKPEPLDAQQYHAETDPIPVNDLHKLIDELAAARAEIERLARKLEEEQTKKDALEAEKTAAAKEEARAKAEKERISKELESLRSQNSTQSGNISKLEDDLSRLDNEKIKWEEKARGLEGQVKVQENSITILKESLSNTKAWAGKNEALLNQDIQKLKTKRRWMKVVMGTGLYRFRTPEYALVPKGPDAPETFVIRNTRSGEWENDFVTGLAFLVWDPSPVDAKTQKIAAGPFVGFGGRNLFSNYYVGGFFMVYSFFLHAGTNIHEFKSLQKNFIDGSELKAGTPIPTTQEWKAWNPYIGIGLDLEVLAEAAGFLGNKGP